MERQLTELDILVFIRDLLTRGMFRGQDLQHLAISFDYLGRKIKSFEDEAKIRAAEQILAQAKPADTPPPPAGEAEKTATEEAAQ